MKDKEKQIEEMAKIIGYCYCDKECQNKCAYCDISSLNEAKKLYENGFRKLPENSVVLSRERYEKLKSLYDEIWDSYYDGENNAKVYYENIKIPRECKATAEKIILSEIETIKTIRDNYTLSEPKYSEGYIDCCNTILFYLKNNLAKQFNIEIKE